MPLHPSRLLVPILALALVLGVGLPVLAVAAPASAAASGLPLSGRVLTSGGAGVGGVVVTVHDPDEDGAVVATATSNAEGQYGVAELPAAEHYEVVATPPADDARLLATVTERVSIGGGDEVLDLVLPVSNVRGVVHGSDGSTAGGATVEVQAWDYHRATTYADGSFRLSLPEGEWEVGALPPAENPALDVGVSARAVVADAVVTLDLTLARPNLRGTVLAPDGTTTVPGARVRVLRSNGNVVPGATGTSRSDGSYGFSVPAGSYRLDVDPPVVNPAGWVGRRSGAVEVLDRDTPDAPRVVDVVLGGPTVTGVVRTPDGDPVPRAWVHVVSSVTGAFSRQRADDAGRYGISVPAGGIEVQLIAPTPSSSYLDHQYELDIPEVPYEQDLVFLEPNARGRVVTADGLPVRGAAISSFGPAGDGTGVRYATTDRQGRFGLFLAPGTSQRVVAQPAVSSPSGVRTAKVVEVPATGGVDLEIELEPAPVPPYDLVPLEVSVGGRVAERVDQPSVSGDGRTVAVRASAGACDCGRSGDRSSGLPSDAATDPPGESASIVLHDRTTGEDDPLVAPNGRAIHPDWPVALDDDGSTVAFVTGQDGLVAGDDDGTTDVFVLDRDADTLTRLERLEDARPTGHDLVVSGDGARVAASVYGWYDDESYRYDVLVADLDGPGAPSSRLVGVRSDDHLAVDLSRDGSTVAWTQFHRTAPGDGDWRLHVLDLASGTEDQPRPFSQGIDSWNGTGGQPSLSDDGSRVAYGDVEHVEVPGSYDIWALSVRLADRVAETDRLVDPFRVADDPAAASIRGFQLSGAGTELVVRSQGGLPEEDEDQVFVVDLDDDTAELVSRAAHGGPAREGVDAVAASSDFSVLALATRSEDLSGSTRPAVVLAVDEGAAPTWPDGSVVTAATGDIGSTSVRLQWTEATDDVRVTGYRVLAAGSVVGTTAAVDRQLRVTGLTPDTSYTFTVQAVDGRGSVSVGGPAVTVRTLPADSTELRPLGATARAGGVVELGWEAAPGADDLVLRTYRGDTQVAERTLAGTATDAVERGLAAATAYSFQVFARTGDTVRAFTERATVTTSALTFPTLTWTVPLVRPDLARHGTTATITATAETGRAVSVAVEHLSWYDAAHELLEEPRTVTSVVALTEVPGARGTYTGGFELVDGVARIVGMVGTVADGHGGTLERASARGPIRVSTDVVLTVDAPAGALAGGRLQVSSESTGQTHSAPVSGGGVVELEHLKPAPDYLVQVIDGRARVAAERTGVRVRDGLTTAIPLDPRLPATLTVAVSGPGGEIVPGTRVVLTDADTERFIDARAVWDESVEFWDVQEDQRVAVDVLYPAYRTMQPEARRTLTLQPGDNRLEYAAAPALRATVSGTVRYDDGSVVAGATVTVQQTFGGETVTRSVIAGADGSYELSALRRTAVLSARSGSVRAATEVDLTDGAVTRDLEIHGARLYVLRHRLFVRPAGATEETGPIPVDWRTSVHYGMTVTVDGAYAEPATDAPANAEESGRTTVFARPGEVVRWCIRGQEARVATTCVEHRLTTGDRSPVLEMHAGPGVDVTVRPVDGAGRPLAEAVTDLYRVTESGREHISHRSRAVRVAHRVPTAGTYLVEAHDGDLSAQRTFTVGPEDDRVDLGDLVLSARTHFTGGENVVVASRPDVLPGGDVELRASWRNNGAAVSGVVARIAVPADAQLVADSVIVDGRPVSVAAGTGPVDVELGTIAADGAGTLRYRLRAAASATGVPGRVDLRYTDAGAVRSEPLNPVTVPVVAVTIGGPGTVSESRIALNGRAPAGATVTITDGGVPVGTAVAGPGGYWSAAVPLVEQPPTRPEHRLVAAVVADGERFFAEHVTQLDATRPAVERISIYQLDRGFPNGRRITFDPLEGVARFPFVFVPRQPIRVEVTFDEPGLVSSVDVLIGTHRVTAARRADGVFVATLTTDSISGPIRVDVDAIAKPLDLGEPEQSEREIRDGAPAPLRGFEISDVQQPDTSVPGPRSGAFTSSIPAVAGGSVRSTLTVTRETYTPTAEDIAMQRATGSPAYAVTSTRSGGTLSFSMLVPLSEIPGLAERAERDGTALGRALADRLRAAAGPTVVERAGTAGVAVGVARVGYQLAFNGATTLDSLLSAIGGGDKYDNLTKAVDLASGCSPAKARAYAERAQNLVYAAAAGDIGGALFNIGAVVFGPATFGLGTVALGVLGWALDKAIGYAIDKATESLVNDIRGDADCKDDEEDDDDKDDLPDPVADPVWIYDPSGYVYEGARSTRVSGVTATLLTATSENGPWTVWDAEWFGQTNPQTTDDAGRYGWDVPEGWWRVAYTKDGYLPAYSRVLRVLPPHLDVDVSMVKQGFPHVTGSVLREGRVDVTFDRLVRSATATRSLRVVDAGGAEVPGTWAAVGATTGDGDLALQRGLRFTPATAPAAGTRLTVTVDGVADYSGRLMAEPYAVTLTAPPPGGGGPTDPPPGPKVPDAPTGVTAVAAERAATVAWTAPEDNGADLVDYVVTVLPGGRQVVVDAEQTSVTVDGLAPGTGYAFTVTARNQVGTGPASAASNQVVPTAVAPDTELTAGPTGVVLSRSATLAWAPTGASYDCELDGRPRPCQGTQVAIDGLAAGTHTFSVAARDADGDVDATPATRTWTVPRDDRTLDGAGWRRRDDGRAFLGTYSQSARRGATLSAWVRGATELAVVVTKGPGSGRLNVYLDGDRLRSVSLAAGTVQQRQVVPIASFEVARSGPVRLVVASRRGAVRVDGLVVTTGGARSG